MGGVRWTVRQCSQPQTSKHMLREYLLIGCCSLILYSSRDVESTLRHIKALLAALGCFLNPFNLYSGNLIDWKSNQNFSTLVLNSLHCSSQVIQSFFKCLILDYTYVAEVRRGILCAIKRAASSSSLAVSPNSLAYSWTFLLKKQ